MKEAQFDLHAAIEEKHWWFLGRREIVRRIVESLPPETAAWPVVDIGCGTGANIASFAKGRRGIGIDSSPEAIQRASARFPQIRFLCERPQEAIRRLDREPAVFLLMDVIEHVEDDFMFLSELLALMEPGSRLVITTPANPALWSEHDVSFGHYRRYTPPRLRMIWEGLPVSVELFSHFNTYLYPVATAFRFMSRIRKRPSGKAGTDFWVPARPVNLLLKTVMASEAGFLLRRLRKGTGDGFRFGVSLIAVLKRNEGSVPVRAKPAGLPPDPHNPRK
ncbi:MAG: methyltransferase domain-containing protein [Candidatus Omnitrophica bacterium]|nr:methyltransferase domain-containing protein [Candidatus Omnitrophota bacterium]